MGRIFLSYAREDRAFAECLARILEAAGHSVWWDRRIDSGEEFSAEIEAQLEKADAVVVAWSKDSVKSRWVRDEAAVGGDTGRLVPVSVDGSLPPMGFRQFHSLDLIGWKGARKDERTQQLLHSVEKRLTGKGRGSRGTAAPLPRRRPSWPTGRWWWIAAAAISFLAAGAAYLLIGGRPADRNSKPTLALLPFTATSSDPMLGSLALQARDSTAHSLSDSGMPTKLIDALAEGDASIGDYLLLGELRASGRNVVATVRLEDAKHRQTVWSRRFETDRAEASVLPDRIGAQVAGTLGWAGALRMLDRREAPDPSLTSDLLRQVDLTGDPLQAYQISQRLAAKWPKSGMVQLSLALNTSFALDQLPRDQRDEALAAARRASERAQTLMPDFGDVYLAECALQPETHIAKCEDRFRAGMHADPDAPFVNAFLAVLLSNVGRTDEAFELARLTYVHDPYMPAKIGLMTRMLAVTGKDEEARRLYQQAIGWWPESGLMFSLLRGLVERGDFQAIVQLRNNPGPGGFPAEYSQLGAIAGAVVSNSPPTLAENCGAGDMQWLEKAGCMLASARLGDMDRAYALADQLYPRRVGRTASEEETIWLNQPNSVPLELITSPAAAPLRRDPRYLQLAQRVALLDYWRSGRPPDFCRKRPEPICVRLLKR